MTAGRLIQAFWEGKNIRHTRPFSLHGSNLEYRISGDDIICVEVWGERIVARRYTIKGKRCGWYAWWGARGLTPAIAEGIYYRNTSWEFGGAPDARQFLPACATQARADRIYGELTRRKWRQLPRGTDLRLVDRLGIRWCAATPYTVYDARKRRLVLSRCPWAASAINPYFAILDKYSDWNDPDRVNKLNGILAAATPPKGRQCRLP